ncbi:hypothetical protein ACFP2T_08245 [Plantactinospora solaniradicis]|uniref:Uncharacterized protein n=1 Tax=Plantactinospora solaniradicis TaxID=1723736 RepID=A0ABW1K363_9ACTN
MPWPASPDRSASTNGVSGVYVTCLACREYAQRRYLELAGYVERLPHVPGTSADIRERAARTNEQYLDIARRFAEPQT